MALGYAVIFFIFSFKAPLNTTITRLTFVRVTLDFFSRHAFSIFLIHSFFIIFAEEALGLKGSAAPEIIIPKILLVIILSCACAIPLTLLSKKASSFFINQFK